MNIKPDASRHFYSIYIQMIKHRLICIDRTLNKQQTTGWFLSDIEFVYLQFRMIFESIILGSISSHHSEYSHLYRGYKKDWNAGKIIQRVKKINKHYYPRPHHEILTKKTTNSKTGGYYEPIETGFLTEKELKKNIGICGNYLHAPNLFGKTNFDEDSHGNTLMEWFNRTMLLLNEHSIIIPPSTKKLSGRRRSKIPADEYIRLSEAIIVNLRWGSSETAMVGAAKFINPAR